MLFKLFSLGALIQVYSNRKRITLPHEAHVLFGAMSDKLQTTRHSDVNGHRRIQWESSALKCFSENRSGVNPGLGGGQFMPRHTASGALLLGNYKAQHALSAQLAENGVSSRPAVGSRVVFPAV